MRKTLPLLAILASSVFFLTGFSPSTASAAANCSTRVTAPDAITGVGINGIFASAGFYNCTSDVSMVRWIYNPVPISGAGFYDQESCNAGAACYAGPGKNGADFGTSCINNGDNGLCASNYDHTNSTGCKKTTAGSCDRYIYVPCWFYGQARHLQGFFTWQIKNGVTNTWGSLHGTFGPLTLVNPGVPDCSA